MKFNNKSGHLCALFTICIWGTTFISTKVLLADFRPIEILFFRFLIGFLVLFLLSPHLLKLKDKKQEFLFMLAGLCGVCLYYLLENIALTYTDATNVGVIISIAPFFTALFSRFFSSKEEKLTARFFIGFIVALSGITLLSFSDFSKIQLNPTGDLLAAAAAVVWAIYAVLTKKISGFAYPVIQTTRRTFFYGILFMIPALWIFDFDPTLSRLAQPASLLNLLFLGVCASAICFVTWNFAVQKLGSVKTSVYIYLVPVITTAASALILKEEVTWLKGIGILLTMLGLFLSEQKGKQRS